MERKGDNATERGGENATEERLAINQNTAQRLGARVKNARWLRIKNVNWKKAMECFRMTIYQDCWTYLQS